MRFFRAIYRLISLFTICLIFLVIGIGLHILYSRNPDKHRRQVARYTRRWAKYFASIMNIHIRLEGKIDIDPNALIVCNHVGSPDIFVVGSCFNTFFISMEDVAKWPIIGKLTTLGLTLYVDRSKKHQVRETIAELTERLKQGHSVVVYPEGQATDGSDVIPFKSSHFEAAVQARRPVVPVMIRYLDPHQPSIACWLNVGFAEHLLKLLMNPRLDVRVSIFAPIYPEPNRRVLAEQSREKIRKAFLEGRSLA